METARDLPDQVVEEVRLVEGQEAREREREEPIEAAPALALMEEVEVEVVVEVAPVEAGVEGCQADIIASIVTPEAE